MSMRDYDPAKDDWTHRVQPRSRRMDQPDQDGAEVCRHTGQPHEYASGECVLCGAEDPFEDRPTIVHAADTRDHHLCFGVCRHESHRRK